MTQRRALLSWSSGKDSAWTLYQLQRDPEVELVGLLTTFNQQSDRVAMHAVRRQLVELQAHAADLPLFPVDLPWPCSNDDYEAALSASLAEILGQTAFDTVAFGDLFLEDIRAYRETQLNKWGYTAEFPIWGEPTAALGATMIAAGLNAVLTCVDPKQCPANVAGRRYDAKLLAELPESVDRCGENGEFHTFVTHGPMFQGTVDVGVGETVERDGFIFTDIRANST
ncbi:MAG: ATP-binding protein [Pseudomonadota bacterium]